MRTSKENIVGLEVYNPGVNTADVILNANENPRNITADYMDEIRDMLTSFEFNRYPDTNCSKLRKAYGEYCSVSMDNVICGNGSDEIIRLAIEAYVDKGEAIVVHDPTFSMYDITGTIVGGRTVKVQAKENFVVMVDDIINAAKENKAKMVFLCNPNNPTGNVFTRQEIIKVLENVDAVIAVDEAYIEFGGQTVVDLIHEYHNLLVLRTMSKAFGLCALRVGFGVGGEDIINSLGKVKAPYNLNQLSQNIALIALSHEDDMKKQVENILANRDKLVEELKKLACLKIYNTHANFIFAKANGERIKEVLGNAVSIRYFGSEYIRISVGEQCENRVLIEKLKELG